MKKVVHSVSCVVFNQRPKALKDLSVLLIRREKEPLKGRWTFPGGRQEPGETHVQATVREVLEETGLSVALLNETTPDFVSELASSDKVYEIKTSAAVPQSLVPRSEREAIVMQWYACSALLAGTELREEECTPGLLRVLNIAISNNLSP